VILPAELKIRRETLGLSQHELALRLGVTEEVFSGWESGRHVPKDPVSIRTLLQDLTDVFVEIIDETVDNLENASGKLNSPTITVRTYLTDREYWEHDTRAARLEIPASMHRQAVGIAVALSETENGVNVTIKTGTDH